MSGQQNILILWFGIVDSPGHRQDVVIPKEYQTLQFVPGICTLHNHNFEWSRVGQKTVSDMLKYN